MAYQTGTANNATDLKDIIETFAQANGWTLSSGILSKGQCHVRLTAINTDQGIKLEGANSADFLTGVCPNWAQFYIASAQWPITYHLFAHGTPDTLVCVLNYNVNSFQYLAFGDIAKFGSWTGGNWFSATMGQASTLLPALSIRGTTVPSAPQVEGATYNGVSYLDAASGGIFSFVYGVTVAGAGGSFLHAEIDGGTWLRPRTGDTVRADSSAYSSVLIDRSPNAWNSQAVLLPYVITVTRPSNKMTAVGEIGHIRALRIDNYNPGDIITIGVDKWKVFPWLKKNSSDRNNSSRTAGESGTIGWAIKYDGP
jgi:hypothetical protein